MWWKQNSFKVRSICGKKFKMYQCSKTLVQAMKKWDWEGEKIRFFSKHTLMFHLFNKKEKKINFLGTSRMIFRVKKKIIWSWMDQTSGAAPLHDCFARELLHHLWIHFSLQTYPSWGLNKLKKTTKQPTKTNHKKYHTIKSRKKVSIPI